ncbi:MAG TPA: hypothetical protein VF244_02855 [Acidimicrobiales bacterium]
MPTPMVFVLAVLTTYLAWWAIARSGLLERPREALYNRWPPSPPRATVVGKWEPHLGEVVMSARGFSEIPPDVSQVAKMVDCPWCCGTWLAGLMTLALDLHGSVPMPALWWPATVVAVVLVDKLASQ